MLWKEALVPKQLFIATTALAYTRRCFPFPFENRRAPDRSEHGARERGPPSSYALAVNNPPGFYFHSHLIISKRRKKKLPALKKFSTWRIMLKKSHISYMSRKKNFISRDLGKKNSYSIQNTHTSPLQKSNG